MLTTEFFNTSKFLVTKLSEQLLVEPNVAMNIPAYILDMVGYTVPTSVTASLIKVVGRDQVVLPTVITVTNPITAIYNFAGTPALLDWDGKTNLILKVIIDTTEVVYVPLVIKA